MRKKSMRLLSVLAMLILMMSLISGCTKKDKVKEVFESYSAKWVEKDFDGMYEMLSDDSKQNIDKNTFVERYNNIYDAIQASGISINISDEDRDKKSLEIPFNMTMDCIAGSIELSGYTATMVKQGEEYKVKWDESMIFPQMQKDDKVRVNDSYAKRGSIIDRSGNLLATDGIIKAVGIHPSKFEDQKEAKIKSMAETLDISESYIEDCLAANSNPEYFVPIVSMLDSESEKLQKLDTIDGVVVKSENSRVYSGGEAIGSLVGYVGSITAEELDEKADKGYTSESLIGKAGLEQVYEEQLRGQDGGEIYIERGSEKIVVASKEPANGKDIKVSIDSELQNKIYAEMNGEKGAATAVDPKTGEVLAMVSSPSYDPNTFMTYKTKAIKEKWDALEGDQFNNRFNNVYAPGSTMKLISGAIALDNGTIDAGSTMDISGLEWQKDESWGGYKITRVHETSGPIGIIEAAKYSDNIFFARLALNMGTDKFIEGLKNFGIGEEMKFEYPMENSQISNDGKLGTEILLADTAYGQGEVMVTPLEIALCYSALGNNGDIMSPRLVLDDESKAEIWKNAIKKDNVQTLTDAFTAVVDDNDGTATAARVEGHTIAAKTGTAEIKKTQDDENGTENGWFVGVDAGEGKIAVSMMIEDVKGRGGSSIPTVITQKVLSYYLNR